jgi:hypothetical protein
MWSFVLCSNEDVTQFFAVAIAAAATHTFDLWSKSIPAVNIMALILLTQEHSTLHLKLSTAAFQSCL